MIQKFNIGLIAKINDPLNPAVLRAVADIDYICSHNKGWTWTQDINRFSECSLLVALGGDGTMIRALKLTTGTKTPCIGFNLGNVGFLTDYDGSSRESIEATLKCVLRALQLGGMHSMSRLPTLEVTVNGITDIAINDVVISGAFADNMVSYTMEFDENQTGKHRANGVIISTPQGSTAYGLSVGGSLIHPSSNVFQVAPIAPIHLTSRPIIVDKRSVMHFVVESKAISIKVDGQLLYSQEAARLVTQEVSIKAHKHDALTIRPDDWNFFENLSRKLHWNE